MDKPFIFLIAGVMIFLTDVTCMIIASEMRYYTDYLENLLIILLFSGMGCFVIAFTLDGLTKKQKEKSVSHE